MKVAIVTPTIGSNFLSKCVESVDKQTYQDLTHYIFWDGCCRILFGAFIAGWTWFF
mgnify:CR=1 FL=1